MKKSPAGHNQLYFEKSPYLQQHCKNPVDWYPWGEEAFAKARSENKLIFLSIGYATCYWCHMMEKDSFERHDVADVLNSSFVCIKVDREERPDVDRLYMDAVVGLTGQGGWPLSVFLTPDLAPFWGGTFDHRSQFITLLERMASLWSEEPSRIENSGREIREAMSAQTTGAGKALAFDNLLEAALQGYEGEYDPEHSGFGSAPKFPPAQQIMLLLRIHCLKGDPSALQMATETLHAMARGGLNDQLAGGFHRYSTDAKWLVPHFEKMLYDNALLARAYSEAFKLTGDTAFAETARETILFLLSDMRSPEGAFYAALDAGEPGKEGEYYVWTRKEVQQELSSEAFRALDSFVSISEGGNFERATNSLAMQPGADFCDRSKGVLGEARQALLALRRKRPAPQRDNKIITSWNAMVISALCSAYRALGERSFLDEAARCASFLREHLYKDGQLWRRYCDGETAHAACLDDYACLVDALLNLHSTSGDKGWLEQARGLQLKQNELLLDPQDGTYFYSHAPELMVSRKDFFDNATPSGNAVSYGNLLRLAALCPADGFEEMAGRLWQSASSAWSAWPTGIATALISGCYGSSVLHSCVGPDCKISALDAGVRELLFAASSGAA